MFVIKYEIDEKKFQDVFNDVAELPITKLKLALNRWRFALAAKMIHNLSGGILNKDTKDLINSINPHQNMKVVQTAEDTVSVVIEGVEPYGAIHETGGTIRAKGKLLAVPLPAIKKPGERAKPLPEFTNTFVKRPQRPSPGHVWTVYEKLAGGAVRPIYTLRTEVTIPARPWFGQSVEDSRESFDKILRNLKK